MVTSFLTSRGFMGIPLGDLAYTWEFIWDREKVSWLLVS
jgi:hypothetical protein